MGGSVLRLCMPSPAPISLSKRLPRSSFGGLRLSTTQPLSSGVRMAAAPSLGRSSRQSVVMMAKREEELKEIRAMSTEEINNEVVDLKGELFMLRLQRSARNEFKSSEFGRMRKRHPVDEDWKNSIHLPESPSQIVNCMAAQAQPLLS